MLLGYTVNVRIPAHSCTRTYNIHQTKEPTRPPRFPPSFPPSSSYPVPLPKAFPKHPQESKDSKRRRNNSPKQLHVGRVLDRAGALRELLLDEEGAEVGELPGGGGGEDDELDDDPADDAGVGGFRVVSELGLTFLGCVSISSSICMESRRGKETVAGAVGVKTHPLEHLLPADIPQPSIQVLDPRCNVLHLALVLALERARLANGKVEVKPDPAVDRPRVLPRGAARVR